ncbi:MAG: hypothetical protein AB7P40_24335, partial [Chloroflexota bacterium]
MLDGTSHLRVTRRGALRMLTATAVAMLAPLASIAHAQSTGESAPGTGTQPSGTQPAGGTDPGNRFASPPTPVASPPAPVASPQPAPSGEPAGSSNASAPASPASQPAGLGWVQNFRATELWSGPDDKAISFGMAPAFSYFRVLSAQDGSRIRVQNPLTNGVAYVTAKDVGPSGNPPEWYLTQKNRTELPARIVGGANIRSTPAVEDGNIVGHAGHNESITILGEVQGADGDTWYRIGQNQMVHSSLVRKPSEFPPHPGKLIVAELTDPCIVTAYEDGKPVYSTLSLKGTVGWGTPTGFFTIV